MRTGIRSLIAAAAFALPVVASAAVVTATDPVTVTLPSDGSTYTIAAPQGSSSGTFDVLDVSNGTMAFTMTSGESIQITASANRTLTNDGGFAPNCAAQSTLIISASGSITVNVTPGGFCTFSAGSAGGGGGGGGSVSPSAPAVISSPPASVATTSIGITATPQQVSAPATPASSVSGGVAYAFRKDLSLGTRGGDVKALQAYLNTHGFPVALRGSGSRGQENTRFGPLTQIALRKFQRAAGITPATGYFGAKTRAFITSHP